MDEESKMKFLLRDPQLYEIGINKECFTFTKLAKFIAYALWHAFIIYIICVYAMNTPGVHQNNGKDVGFWVGGMTCFGCAIFLANFVLALHSKTLGWPYLFLLFLGPLSYFVFYWLLNMIMLGEITNLFVNNFSIGLVFYVIILALLSTYIIDKMREIYENFQTIDDDLPDGPFVFEKHFDSQGEFIKELNPSKTM